MRGPHDYTGGKQALKREQKEKELGADVQENCNLEAQTSTSAVLTGLGPQGKQLNDCFSEGAGFITENRQIFESETTREQ